MKQKTATRALAVVVIAGMAWAAMSSFQPKNAETKTYKFEFSAEETQVIFEALGELPAKKSEVIRFKMAQEVNKQNQPQQTNPDKK